MKDLTYCVVFKAGSSVASTYNLGGNAAGPGPVCFFITAGHIRIRDFGTAQEISFTDLTLTANSVHFFCARRTGNVWDAWLDGTKSTLGGATGTANFLSSEFLFGTDSSTNITEQFPGYMAHPMLWGVAKNDSTVTDIYTQMKLIYNTP